MDSAAYKKASAFAARELQFYEKQAGKSYEEICTALAAYCPALQQPERLHAASRIYKKHKAGKTFRCPIRSFKFRKVATIHVFSVSLSKDAATYVDWDIAAKYLDADSTYTPPDKPSILS